MTNPVVEEEDEPLLGHVLNYTHMRPEYEVGISIAVGQVNAVAAGILQNRIFDALQDFFEEIDPA